MDRVPLVARKLMTWQSTRVYVLIRAEENIPISGSTFQPFPVQRIATTADDYEIACHRIGQRNSAALWIGHRTIDGEGGWGLVADYLSDII